MSKRSFCQDRLGTNTGKAHFIYRETAALAPRMDLIYNNGISRER
eukprot:COSAG06_NODE_29439_length_556_cov_1.150985_1_plen_44_part_10